jgi:cytochrome P450
MTNTAACPYAPSDTDRLFQLEPQVVKCPFPLYEVLRNEAPVFFNERLNAWVVSRQDDVIEVLRDPQTYSSATASGASSTTGLAKKLIEDPATPERLRKQAQRRVELAGSPVLLFTDPPLHKRQRSMVNAAFHPRRVKLLEPDVRQLTNELIDRFIDAGRVELVHNFSIQLPMTVIAVLLGVPPSKMDTFKHWSNCFTAGVGAIEQSPERLAEIFEAVDSFYDYFSEQLAARRAQPQDDLLSDLLAARMDGETPLTENEILQMLVQFLVAGNETTTNMLTSVMCRFAMQPELQDQVRNDLTLVPALIEEMLRVESPVQGMFRTTTQDTVLHGQAIPAGAMLWLAYGSANRDPDVYEDADNVDLGAEREPHLAFSRGEHFCLGANIAKLELRIAIEILLTRLADIALDCDPESIRYNPSFILRGISNLPLTFTARTRDS